MYEFWIRLGPGAGPNGEDVFAQGNRVIINGKTYQIVREEAGGVVILAPPGEVKDQRGTQTPPPPPAPSPFPQIPGRGDAGVGASGTVYSTAEAAYPPGDPRNQGPPILTGNNNAPPVPATRGPAGGPGSYGNTGIVPPHLRRPRRGWNPGTGYEIYATLYGVGVPLNIAQAAAAFLPGAAQFGLLGGQPGDETRGFLLSGPAGPVMQLGQQTGRRPEDYGLPAWIGARTYDLAGGGSHTVLLDWATVSQLLMRR